MFVTGQKIVFLKAEINKINSIPYKVYFKVLEFYMLKKCFLKQDAAMLMKRGFM